ncbi:uncharacterized protein RSE6_14060 [Rhynchosporium secalis]|uniref:Uncharacterized protein n=1 Tax=Rhynchosporium secalis TaxID=38038 RepID=A0A1E1MUG4_RHYSE|nr:uncharacterized protein RSE6_14060 [Rhynchosporium secalis]
MVKLATIREENLRYEHEHHTGFVCNFAGATSGIGAATLERMVKMISNSTFFVIGRSEESFAVPEDKLEALHSINKRMKYEVKKVDYVLVSPGMYPLNGAEYTKEGLEVCFAISYYSRIRLITNLLPLLRQSPNPRVLSVLCGGKEKFMLENDIGLHQN